MRILIGSPVHQIKEYCIERWLHNVQQVRNEYPADFLMIDNTEGDTFVEKIQATCEKNKYTKYSIEHFEVVNAQLAPDKARHVNVEISQELLRQATLRGKYDAWFSWECDQIIPADTLKKMVRISKKQPSDMLVVNSWSRTDPNELNANMGITLLNRSALQKAWFLPFQEGQVSFDLKDFYNVDETLFKKRLLKAGGTYIELYGVIAPILHLDK